MYLLETNLERTWILVVVVVRMNRHHGDVMVRPK